MACFSSWDIGACGCVAPGVICATCTPASIPFDLFVTDGLGTYTASWDGSTKWTTAMLCSGTVGFSADYISGGPVCHFPLQNGNALYYYDILCTGTNLMSIRRIWREANCVTPQYAPCGCVGGVAWASGQATANPTVTCGAVAWSGTLTHTAGARADPVGGTTSFTQ